MKPIEFLRETVFSFFGSEKTFDIYEPSDEELQDVKICNEGNIKKYVNFKLTLLEKGKLKNNIVLINLKEGSAIKNKIPKILQDFGYEGHFIQPPLGFVCAKKNDKKGEETLKIILKIEEDRINDLRKKDNASSVEKYYKIIELLGENSGFNKGDIASYILRVPLDRASSEKSDLATYIFPWAYSYYENLFPQEDGLSKENLNFMKDLFAKLEELESAAIVYQKNGKFKVKLSSNQTCSDKNLIRMIEKTLSSTYVKSIDFLRRSNIDVDVFSPNGELYSRYNLPNNEQIEQINKDISQAQLEIKKQGLAHKFNLTTEPDLIYENLITLIAQKNINKALDILTNIKDLDKENLEKVLLGKDKDQDKWNIAHRALFNEAPEILNKIAEIAGDEIVVKLLNSKNNQGEIPAKFFTLETVKEFFKNKPTYSIIDFKGKVEGLKGFAEDEISRREVESVMKECGLPNDAQSKQEVKPDNNIYLPKASGLGTPCETIRIR